MTQNPELSGLLADIEIGPTSRKREALGRLRLMPEVPLSTIQPTLDKMLERVPEGSALSFFAASNLAARGDQRTEVTNVLMPYMAEELLKDEDGKPVAFPWLIATAKTLGAAAREGEDKLCRANYEDLLDCVRDRGYPEELIRPGFVWQHSAQLATLEAISYLRHDDRVTDTLIETMDGLSAPIWRALFLYSLASLGNPKSKQKLEYYRDQYATSLEGGAARLALENFGSKTFSEFVQLHQSSVKKGGCFIATATYGSAFAPEVLVFRRFRDEVLLSSEFGSLFVEAYYRISPPVASLVSKVQLLRNATKYFLFGPILWLIKTAERYRN